MANLIYHVEAGNWESINKRLTLVVKDKLQTGDLEQALIKHRDNLLVGGYGFRTVYFYYNNRKYLVLEGVPNGTSQKTIS